jgi:predicted nucleic acid-binding protein
MSAGRPVVFDTSVYVTALRGGSGSAIAALLRRCLPRTHLAAVVAAELRAGAASRDACRALQQVVRRAQAVRRFVTPTAASWLRAGEVLSSIRTREPQHRSKLPALWVDLLVALSARQIGACVVTANRADFVLIRRHLEFPLEPLG